MSTEIQDGHQCENCLRWPECNGVDWQNCMEKTTPNVKES